MPLDRIKIDILSLLASHRDPESYVAGSTPLNRDAPRYSGDIDVFHDREERVERVAGEDGAVLETNGYALQWLKREPPFFSVLASKAGETTEPEWAVDSEARRVFGLRVLAVSDFRFFPTMRDEAFGYILHPVDLAMNKVMAAAGRREPGDVVDLLTIHDRILPLGAVILAAVAKPPALRPKDSSMKFAASPVTRKPTFGA